MPRGQRPVSSSRLLSLPLELRLKIYEAVVDDIIEEDQRIFSVPDVLERDINKYPTMAIAHHKGWKFRQPGKGPFIMIGGKHTTMAIHHNDISSLVCLGQACKSLREETLALAWRHADFTAQGSFEMIRALLGPRLVLSMTPTSKSAIKTLNLILGTSWKEGSLQAMQQIVQLIKSHIPKLETLTISHPYFRVIAPLSSAAKAVVATLLELSPDLEITFYAYHYLRPRVSHVLGHYTETVKLLTEKHASNRLIRLDRQRKKEECEDVDPVHYIWKNLGLLSFARWTIDEDKFCCFDHEVRNYLNLCYKTRRVVLRCSESGS